MEHPGDGTVGIQVRSLIKKGPNRRMIVEENNDPVIDSKCDDLAYLCRVEDILDFR